MLSSWVNSRFSLESKRTFNWFINVPIDWREATQVEIFSLLSFPLGGNDIRDNPTDERFDMIYMYAQSMNKASRPDLAKIRVKPHYDLKDFQKHMQR